MSKIPHLLRFVPAILALLTGIAGWFYLFYSRAAEALAGYERQRLNRLRVRLRRVGGLMMLFLAAGLAMGFYGPASDAHPRIFLCIWLLVFVLLGMIVLLALIDVRLTWNFRYRRPAAADPEKGTDIDRTPLP